ncbi:unnamed protein product [Merluccius merluccius]
MEKVAEKLIFQKERNAGEGHHSSSSRRSSGGLQVGWALWILKGLMTPYELQNIKHLLMEQKNLRGTELMRGEEMRR